MLMMDNLAFILRKDASTCETMHERSLYECFISECYSRESYSLSAVLGGYFTEHISARTL